MHSRKARRRFPMLEVLERREVLSLYFVSPTGNDAAAGSSTAPWKTLQKAANTVHAGDTVTVRAGTYSGFDLWESGTAAAPIVFQAEPGVVINAPNSRTADGINLEGASHIVIDGFKVVGVPRAGIRAVLDDHVTIRNNVTDSNGHWGIFTGFSANLLIENNTASRSSIEHGIYVSNSADNPVVRGNIVFGNRASGIQLNADLSQGGDGIITNALIENNIIYDNGLGGGAALNNDGVQDSIFRNNLLYDNHASGIVLYAADGAEGSKNNLVVNNTIVNAGDGRWAAFISNGSTGNVLYNNILYTGHLYRGAIDIDTGSLPGFVSDYNIVLDRLTPDGEDSILTLAQWRAATGQDQHSLVATPAQLFVNPAGADYHLKAGSVAIDAGTSSSAPNVDYEGTPRPNGATWDIGADEYSSSAPVVPAILQFDFGTLTSPVATGYNRVAATTTFSAATGFGWLSGAIDERDRASGTDITRDFDMTADGLFGVNVANGSYDVTVTLGDPSFTHGPMAVSLEGTQLDTLVATGGVPVTKTYHVTVADGQLTLGLKNLGTSYDVATINALQIVPSSSEPTPSGPTYRYDFGTATSPVAAGYERVTAATAFSAATGFGWSAGTIEERDRQDADDLDRDFNFTANGVFVVNMANGVYDVTVTLGDTWYAHGPMSVGFEGAQVDIITAAAGQTITKTYRVTVADGQLTLGLKNLGVSYDVVTINALQIVTVSSDPTPPPPPPDPSPTTLLLDFGTSTSPVGGGYTRVTSIMTYDPGMGFGWLSGVIEERDRGGGSSITRDFNMTADGVFAANIANGTYDVTVTLGDQMYKHGPMGVSLEGVPVGTLSTTKSATIVTRVYRVTVTDGQLTLGLKNMGADGDIVAINALAIVPVASTSVLASSPFDFGTATSPVAAGYERVTAATVYSDTTGFGWLSGVIEERDRAGGSDLDRDFNMTTDGVFAVNVANGTYDVAVTLGDPSYAHGPMAVLLEGAQVDTVTTAAGQKVTKTYRVTVTDGQLTLGLKNLGASYDEVVINGLTITLVTPA